MKKILSILLLAVLVSALCIFCACSFEYRNSRRTITSVGHRGCGNAPENTLVAFEMAAEMGFDTVECDVRFTSDGNPVLLHDDSVSRTSNGTGFIDEMTLHDVRQLDFGSWKGSQFAKEKIPTFEEFADLCRELELAAYVEIKGEATDEQLQYLLDTATSLDLDVSWISMQLNVLQRLAVLDPEARIGYVVSHVSEQVVKDILALKTRKNSVFVDCKYQNLSEDWIVYCKKKHLPVEVWTVDDREVIQSINPYISGITSNYLVAQQVFKEIRKKV